jgi:ketosteroid isomerase-like protein
MNVTYNAIKSILLAMVLYCCTSVATAQEWSTVQKEAWKTVETYWSLDGAGDVQGMLSYFHAEYVGWNFNDAVTGSKEKATKYLTYYSQRGKMVFDDLTPVSVKVYGDVAICHYYYFQVIEDKDGKRTDSRGRWTDVLRKTGDRWMLIGDAGGKMKD